MIIIYWCFFGFEKDLFEKKNEVTKVYNLGKLEISSNLVQISIRTTTYFNYFCSFFDRKLVFLLIVNLCSRASKIKFKIDYKHHFQEDDDSSIWFEVLNFFCSFIIFGINIIIKRLNNSECCNSNENSFSSFILFENIMMLVISLLLNFFYSYLGDNWIKWISFKAILISGSVNFIFSEYYFNEYINYLSISGVVSFSQCIFRFIEFFSEYLNDIGYWLQILFSFIAIFSCFLRFECCCKDNYYKCSKCELFNNFISCYNKCVEKLKKCKE